MFKLIALINSQSNQTTAQYNTTQHYSTVIMSSTISKDEKKAITAISRALKASDKKLAQATIKLAKAQLKDTSNACKAISKAFNAEDKKLAKKVAAEAKKFLKDLEKSQKRKLKNAKEVVRATRSFFKVNPALIPIVSDYFEIDDLDIPFEDFCYDKIRYISSQVYEDALSIYQQKAISTSPKGLELVTLTSDVYILLLFLLFQLFLLLYL